MCFFAGGLKYKEQEFKATAAQLNSSLLTMSVISLIIPAGFHATLGDIPDPTERPDLLSISRGVAVILLLIYFGYVGPVQRFPSNVYRSSYDPFLFGLVLAARFQFVHAQRSVRRR